MAAASTPASAPLASSATIKVMTWNVLADGLAQFGEFSRVRYRLFVVLAVRPHPGIHAFTYFRGPQADPAVLTWESRAPRILDEIARRDPDVVCLQEVTHFHDTFMRSLGGAYEGVLARKGVSPMGGDLEVDGVALLVRRSRVALVGAEVVTLSDVDGRASNQRAIVASLRVASDRGEEDWVVATTHLKAKGGVANELLRASQIAQVLDRAAVVRAGRRVPVVVCGDMNATPGDSKMWDAALAHPLGVVPAVHRFLGLSEEPAVARDDAAPFTTWKYRWVDGHDRRAGDRAARRWIDHIFTVGVRTLAVDPLPTTEVIGPAALPSETIPSDHLPLVAVFASAEEA